MRLGRLSQNHAAGELETVLKNIEAKNLRSLLRGVLEGVPTMRHLKYAYMRYPILMEQEKALGFLGCRPLTIEDLRVSPNGMYLKRGSRRRHY